MNRFFIFIFLIVFLSVPAFAEQRTLLEGDVDIGYYGAPVVKVSTFDGDVGLMGGFQGAVVLNGVFTAGAGGYMLLSEIGRRYEKEDAVLMLGYGGLELGAIIASDSVVHGAVRVLAGGGRVGYHERTWRHDMGEGMLDSAGFFVIEPAADVEINILPFLRLAAGGGYRFVLGLDDRLDLTGQDMSAPFFEIMVKFGIFSGGFPFMGMHDAMHDSSRGEGFYEK